MPRALATALHAARSNLGWIENVLALPVYSNWLIRVSFKGVSPARQEIELETFLVIVAQISAFFVLLLAWQWAISAESSAEEAFRQKSATEISSQHSGSSGIRNALLIGNQSYPWGPLETPLSDVSAVDQGLRSIGFKVRTAINLTQNALYEAVDEFLRSQAHGDTLLFFYAGHSIQLNGRNYLVPIDAKIDDPDLLSKLFDLSYLLENLSPKKSRTVIIILDACRSNPFSGLPKASAGLSELVAPPNTFIAFSTAPGKTAEDGDSKHSPYTLGLLKYLFQPNTKIEDSFKSIRRYVRDVTENRQTPWENTSLEYDFFLAQNNTEMREKKPGQRKTDSMTDSGKNTVDRSLCKKILIKYSLGMMALSVAEAEAAPLCK